MRKEKALISLLRDLVDLLAEESSHNPEFASKLNSLLSELPDRRKVAPKRANTKPSVEQPPDIYEEKSVRGDTDFRLWLQELPIPTLRAIIRKEGLDATRRTTKWKEPEKLAEFISDSLQMRQSRGSAFLGREIRE